MARRVPRLKGRGMPKYWGCPPVMACTGTFTSTQRETLAPTSLAFPKRPGCRDARTRAPITRGGHTAELQPWLAADGQLGRDA